MILAALVAASSLLQGCATPARGGLKEVMRSCTAYGPLRAGKNGFGFGAAFTCDGIRPSKALEPKPR